MKASPILYLTRDRVRTGGGTRWKVVYAHHSLILVRKLQLHRNVIESLLFRLRAQLNYGGAQGRRETGHTFRPSIFSLMPVSRVLSFENELIRC